MYAFLERQSPHGVRSDLPGQHASRFLWSSKIRIASGSSTRRIAVLGNGILELTTFLAIIAGAVVGPILAQSFHGRAAIAGLIFAACSLFGLATSFFFISRVPPADPSKTFRINIFGDLRKQISARAAGPRPTPRHRWQYLLLVSGALLQFVIVFYGREVLHLDEKHGGYLQAALAIGIGVGSYAAGLLSGWKDRIWLDPSWRHRKCLCSRSPSPFHGLSFSPGVASCLEHLVLWADFSLSRSTP